LSKSIKCLACDQTNSRLFSEHITESIPHNFTPLIIKGMPFIIRGVKLWGIDSVMCSEKRREFVWSQAKHLIDFDKLHQVTQIWSLEDLLKSSSNILKGEISGRVIVDVNK
jgi:NADPH:quinone reductase-like Zn-dependent oxidoreductase